MMYTRRHSPFPFIAQPVLDPTPKPTPEVSNTFLLSLILVGLMLVLLLNFIFLLSYQPSPAPVPVPTPAPSPDPTPEVSRKSSPFIVISVGLKLIHHSSKFIFLLSYPSPLRHQFQHPRLHRLLILHQR